MTCNEPISTHFCFFFLSINSCNGKPSKVFFRELGARTQRPKAGAAGEGLRQAWDSQLMGTKAHRETELLWNSVFIF